MQSAALPNTCLTKSEVAILFRCTVQTVDVWVRTHKLPVPCRVGERSLFRADEIRRVAEGSSPRRY